MYKDKFDYLSEQELALLDHSTTIVNLLHNVAELRRRNEELEMERINRMQEINESMHGNNAFIGNILSAMVRNAENSKS